VLAGVVVFMVVLGFVHQVQRSVAGSLDWVLPVAYIAVAALGVAMIVGRNPVTRLATTESPIARSPTGSAFPYGTLLAPMTMPCTGPLVASAFASGGVAGTGQLADLLVSFVPLALGFGSPVVVLPSLAVPVQRRATRCLAIHHRAIGVASGVLLVTIAVFGWWTELRPTT
jgi:cytochrome c biogenesis protein CcdA